MIQLIGDRYYDFDQLGAELTMSGVEFTSLGTDGATIFTYDDAANQISLPPEADPIIGAHVPSHLQHDLIALQMQPAVGLSVVALDPVLLQLLVAGLAYNAGACDPTTLAVLPIDRWLR